LSFDTHKWETVALNAVCSYISRGITPSYTETNGVMVINQKCIRDKMVSFEHVKYTDPNKRKIPEDKYLRKYDILVNSTGVGTLGRVAQIRKLDKPCTVDSHVTIVRPNGTVNPVYLGYAIIAQQKRIEEMGEGSTGQIELSRKRLAEEIFVNIPSKREQDELAKLLVSLDDKIELNNAINKNLEEMAQALFKHWFVDFEFPNENGEPYKSSGGEFVESELGLIPKGWRIATLGEIVEIASGRRPSARQDEPSSECSIPLIGASGIMGYVTDALYDEPIIVTGRVGTLGVVKRYRQKCWPSDNTLVIRSRYFEFVYQQMKQIDIKSLNRGSTQPLVSQTDLKNVKFIMPEIDIMKKFESVVSSFYILIEKNIGENDRLRQIRDTLLPKLMSGEIRVPVEKN